MFSSTHSVEMLELLVKCYLCRSTAAMNFDPKDLMIQHLTSNYGVEAVYHPEFYRIYDLIRIRMKSILPNYDPYRVIHDIGYNAVMADRMGTVFVSLSKLQYNAYIHPVVENNAY
jgi:hypothetical protein